LGQAGSAFAACKAKSLTRADVYNKVVVFSKTDEAKGLNEYNAHFVQAIIAKFESSGLGR
jgi:hypothetical protein